MVDCSKCDDAVSFYINNPLQVAKTFRLFGGSTTLEQIEDNGPEFNVLSPIPSVVASGPNMEIFDSATGYLYVGSTGNNIAVVDTATNQVLRNISTFSGPQNMLLVPSIQRLYVMCNNASGINQLVVIDTATGLTVVGSGANPIFNEGEAVYSPVNGYLYIVSLAGVSIYNTAGLGSYVDIVFFGTMDDPMNCHIVYDPIHDQVYVSDYSSNGIYVIDCASNLVVDGPIPADAPTGMLYHDGFVYASSLTDGTVYLIDTADNSISNIFPFFSITPSKLVYLETTDTIYALSASSGSEVFTINPSTKLPGSSVPSGSGPVDLIYNSFDRFVYILNSIDNTVTVYDSLLTEIQGTINTGQTGASDITFNPITGYNYVVNGTSNSVSVTSSTPAASITVNGGNTSMEQINSDFVSNPACLCYMSIATSDQAALNTPISKNRMQSTGSVLDTSISLLQKFNVNDVQSLVVLDKSDFKTCDLDGENYLEWQVPAGSNISILVGYCQLKRIDLLGKDKLVKPKRKKYMHGAFKFAIN
jgi:YVTN family beta-propeller protein